MEGSVILVVSKPRIIVQDQLPDLPRVPRLLWEVQAPAATGVQEDLRR